MAPHDPSTEDRNRPKSSVVAILLVFMQLVLIGIALCTVAGWFGAVNLHCELLCNFKLQYLVGAIGCLAMLAIGRRWRWAAVAMVLVIYHAALIVPWYLPADQTHRDNPGHRLKLLVANVFTANTDHQRLLDRVEQEQPDVVVLMEVDRRWVAAMEPLTERMPVHLAEPRSHNFGIALFSRLPIDKLQTTYFGNDLPSITGELRWAGQTIRLVATHPLPPINPGNLQSQRDHLSAIADSLVDHRGPIILAGDLNCTLWSSTYRNLMERLPTLRNSRESFGVLGSWPTGFRSSLLRIPIDHCLVSDDLAVLDCRTGQAIGSDHLPLIVTLGRR